MNGRGALQIKVRFARIAFPFGIKFPGWGNRLKSGPSGIKLGPFVKKCLKHRAPDPAFHAIQGHNEDLSKAMYIAWGTVFSTGAVDHKLKEIIRVQLSRAADCNY